MKNKMKMKLILTWSAMVYVPSGIASGNGAYPKEKVAAFVLEQLDITSLPSLYRPKKEKGKKTFADYGYKVQRLEENEALIAPSDSAPTLSVKILQESAKEIYACVSVPAQEESNPKVQRVMLLKRKNSNGLLKGRESWREFSACPAIGGNDSTASSYGD
jgi:hypothetical protein